MEPALRKHPPGAVCDSVSPTRSKAMAAVKGRGNKTTERRLRLGLVRTGVRGWKVRPRGFEVIPISCSPRPVWRSSLTAASGTVVWTAATPLERTVHSGPPRSREIENEIERQRSSSKPSASACFGSGSTNCVTVSAPASLPWRRPSGIHLGSAAILSYKPRPPQFS